jgi:hydroxyethylthiazole kinase-like uncharacterized protein yjeF
MYLVTANEMRQMDRTTIETFGIPGRLLMENAGRGATAFFLEAIYKQHPGPVGVLTGRGNNGGDGFVMARYLHQKGIPVTVYVLADQNRIEGDAATNLALLKKMAVPFVEVSNEDLFHAAKSSMVHQCTWIDAILGTGLNSDVRGHLKTTIQFIKRQKRPVFAVDIASGLNADTGQICGVCIEAAATATFGFAKVGHLTYPGKSMTGKLKIIEIGIPPSVAEKIACGQHLITPDSLVPAIPNRPAVAHKGNNGHVVILAGSPGKTGAAAMAATTAMRAGAGLVTLGVPRSLNPVLETMVTEAMTVSLPETDELALAETAFETALSLVEEKQCLAVGPGIGTHPSTGRLVRRLIKESPAPLVMDADALNLIAADTGVLKKSRVPIVLTPHPGEMARLSGDSTATIQNDRVASARSFALKHKVTLVLKGAATVIADPGGDVFINPTGNPGMAAGGMGDVLTGLIAGLLAQGMEPGPATRASVFLHGLAADIVSRRDAPIGYLATEVMDAIPQAMKDLKNNGCPGVYPQRDPLFHSPGEGLSTA